MSLEELSPPAPVCKWSPVQRVGIRVIVSPVEMGGGGATATSESISAVGQLLTACSSAVFSPMIACQTVQNVFSS